MFSWWTETGLKPICTNHRPMPQVHAIKNPQRQMQRLIQPGKLLKVTQHQHAHWINRIIPPDKPASGSLPRELLDHFGAGAFV